MILQTDITFYKYSIYFGALSELLSCTPNLVVVSAKYIDGLSKVISFFETNLWYPPSLLLQYFVFYICYLLYFRVCVGIQVPPESSEWFCRFCISRKEHDFNDKKKKNRKKKGLHWCFFVEWYWSLLFYFDHQDCDQR
jgi:hypothetical protein